MKLNQIIDECVSRTIKEFTTREKVKALVTEEIERALNEKKKGQKKDTKSSVTKRRAVQKALSDPMIKQAPIAYKLYHPKDQGEKDTVRSLFSKKASNRPDSEGNVRRFTDTEINKIYQLIKKH